VLIPRFPSSIAPGQPCREQFGSPPRQRWLAALALTLVCIAPGSALSGECNDGLDGDGDGLADYGLNGADPECLTPDFPSEDPAIRVRRRSAGTGYLSQPVAVDGDLVVSARPWEHDAGWKSGAAYVFRRDAGGQWSMEATLLDSAATPLDEFGDTVAVSGDTIIVGSEEADEDFAGAPPGTAVVFRWNGSTWTEEARLAPSDGAFRFGWRVAIEGDRAVVTAHTFPGAAYVFERQGAIWTQVARLFSPDQDEYDYFGSAVALHGDVIAVGASYDDFEAELPGAIYLYRRVAGTWVFEAQLRPPELTENDIFGNALALAGDTLLAGALSTASHHPLDRSGVFVYRHSGGSWVRSELLQPAAGSFFDRFGSSVALSGGRAVVGAPGESLVYVLRDDAGTWVWESQVTAAPPPAPVEDELGRAVAFDGTTLLAHATLDLNVPVGIGYPAHGRVRVLREGPSGWEEEARLHSMMEATGDRFASAIALGSSTWNSEVRGVFGAPGEDESAPDAGAAYVTNESDPLSPSRSKLMYPSWERRETTRRARTRARSTSSGRSAVTISASRSSRRRPSSWHPTGRQATPSGRLWPWICRCSPWAPQRPDRRTSVPSTSTGSAMADSRSTAGSHRRCRPETPRGRALPCWAPVSSWVHRATTRQDPTPAPSTYTGPTT
jgi:hypothetical protein